MHTVDSQTGFEQATTPNDSFETSFDLHARLLHVRDEYEARLQAIATQHEEVLQAATDESSPEIVAIMEQVRPLQDELSNALLRLDQEFAAPMHEYASERTEDLWTTCLQHNDILMEFADRYDNGRAAERDEEAINAFKELAHVRTLLADSVNATDYELAEHLLERLDVIQRTLNDVGITSEDRDADVASLNDRLSLRRAYKTNAMYLPLLTPPSPEARYIPAYQWKAELTNDERQAMERHLKMSSVAHEIEQIDVRGTETLFSNVDATVEVVLSVTPAVALESVRRIDFDAAVDTARHYDGTWVTSAQNRYLPDENLHDITVRANEYQRAAIDELPEDTRELAKNVALVKIAASLHHELGHSLHSVLPVALLDEYYSAMVSANEQEATDYTAITKEHNPLVYEREDFADSYAMYQTQNGRFMRDSSVRYAAMERLLTAIMPEEQFAKMKRTAEHMGRINQLVGIDK